MSESAPFTIERTFAALGEGAMITMPLQDTFWGAVFGGLTDKYGNHWLLNFSKETGK